MRSLVKKIKKPSMFSLLIMSVWGFNGFIYYFKTAVLLVAGAAFANLLLTLYFVFLTILSMKELSKRITVMDLGFIPLMLLIVLLSFVFNVTNRDNILNHITELFFLVVPCYFIGLSIDSEEKTMKDLYLISILTIIVNYLYLFVILGTGREMQSDNLAIAYMVLPHVLFVLLFSLKYKKAFSFFFAIAGSIFVLFMGSRGPILSIVVFFALWTLFRFPKMGHGKRLLVLLLVTFIVWFVMSDWFTLFLLNNRDIAVRLNVSTRIFDAILYQAADGSNKERAKIYEIMWSYIQKRPLLGYGIYGEWMMIDYSAHNMILELYTHYGIIIGSVVAVSFFALMGNVWVKNRNEFTRGFILVMFCFGVVRGIYAGSYLTDYMFLLFGFLVRQYRLSKLNGGILRDV